LNEEEPRLVEAEVVGLEPPPPSLWQRIKARLKVSLFLAALGLALFIGGLFFTLTLVGAPIGVPLMIVGALCVLAAFWILIGGGIVIGGRRPRP
jgi:hypothetical protein